MLKLDVRLSESFDNDSQMFVYETFELELEHSLVSLSKWESKYEKPFLSDQAKTPQELIDYVTFMIITPDYPENIVYALTEDHAKQINDYIAAKQTATWFPEGRTTGPSRAVITSEVIYYWLSSWKIPWEAQYWHLNRLFTLIRVFDAHNDKDKNKKKPNTAATVAERRAINERNKALLKTKG